MCFVVLLEQQLPFVGALPLAENPLGVPQLLVLQNLAAEALGQLRGLLLVGLLVGLGPGLLGLAGFLLGLRLEDSLVLLEGHISTFLLCPGLVFVLVGALLELHGLQLYRLHLLVVGIVKDVPFLLLSLVLHGHRDLLITLVLGRVGLGLLFVGQNDGPGHDLLVIG